MPVDRKTNKHRVGSNPTRVIIFFRGDKMGSTNDMRNLTIEVQKQSELMRSIAQSCRAQAIIDYLTKLKESNMIHESTYEAEIEKVAKNLLGFDLFGS